ncbi:hypothetical protein [Thermithiobacillus plumbiphilus]|uniref:Zinc-finger domain-containing protein n=1 Tax=Thermithiobacillus plumbiphilus TaxID=1729899 RepID=A0ABU9DD00_9PROT
MISSISEHLDTDHDGAHPDEILLDQWRAEILDPSLSQQVADHVRECRQCQQQSSQASLWVKHLDSLPHPHLRPRAAPRKLPGMAPVYRFGAALATLVLVAGLGWQMQSQQRAPVNVAMDDQKALQDPGTRELLSDLEFYRWLAEHPEVLQKNHHDA